jgi:hypothetical protein
LRLEVGEGGQERLARDGGRGCGLFYVAEGGVHLVQELGVLARKQARAGMGWCGKVFEDVLEVVEQQEGAYHI